MKKNVLILILALSIIPEMYAQKGYAPLVDVNRKWSIVNFGNIPTRTTHYVKFTGDSVIGADTFKLVMRCNDSLQQNWIHIGYIREEKSKKVYFMDLGFNEGLIYNFALNVNDSAYVMNLNVGYPGHWRKVQQIDSVQVSGVWRKRFTFYPGPSNDQWVVALGSYKGVIWANYDKTDNNNYQLLCMWENNVKKYQNPNFTTCWYKKTNAINTYEPGEFDVLVIPNPISDQDGELILQTLKAGKYYLIITDITGRMMMNQPIDANQSIALPRKSFSSGLYLFTVYRYNFPAITGKFMVD